MTDNKKIIALSILAVLLVGSAGLAFWFFRGTPELSTGLDKLKIGNLTQEKNFLEYEEKTACEGSSTDQLLCQEKLLAAVNNDSQESCAGLPSENERLVCRKNQFIRLAANSANLDKCDEFIQESDRKLCKSQVAFSLALQKQESKYCDFIENENDRHNCQSLLEQKKDSLDGDGDGLSDQDEIKYGTDPAKADSDNDGHQDGQEVEAGFNPLGEGKK